MWEFIYRAAAEIYTITFLFRGSYATTKSAMLKVTQGPWGEIGYAKERKWWVPGGVASPILCRVQSGQRPRRSFQLSLPWHGPQQDHCLLVLPLSCSGSQPGHLRPPQTSGSPESIVVGTRLTLACTRGFRISFYLYCLGAPRSTLSSAGQRSNLVLTSPLKLPFWPMCHFSLGSWGEVWTTFHVQECLSSVYSQISAHS